MKKNTLILTVIFLCIAAFTYAQTEYEWEHYGVGFSVTEDFEVEVNNEKEFTAVSSDGLIDISVLPWSDGTVNEDDLDEHLIDFASEIFDEADDLVADDLEIDDFIGSFLVAQQNEALILAAFMLDIHSQTNVTVQITFEEGNEDEAIKILESFYAFD